jgi:hypothetical protein
VSTDWGDALVTAVREGRVPEGGRLTLAPLRTEIGGSVPGPSFALQ